MNRGLWGLIGFVLVFVGCGPSSFQSARELSSISEITHEDLLKNKDPITEPPPVDEGVPHADPPSDPESVEYINLQDFIHNQKICSGLSFDGVLWPVHLTSDTELKAFLLALNISGSFEGNNGFKNISNNFDGQGLSLGLLNQNFGQGSLQPLMIKAYLKSNNIFQEYFSSNHQNSLEGMLRVWASDRGFTTSQSVSKNLNYDLYSPLDKALEQEFVQTMSLSWYNQKSVDWAVSNLYSGSQFVSSWKSEFTAFAESPEYVVEQMQAAMYLHNRARSYQEDLGFDSIRSYLLFFDIAVQNGSLKSADITDYKAYLASGHEQDTEEEKLNKIVELRLRHVLSQWRQDVLIRKSSLINGFGKVHGAERNYPSEYCFRLDDIVTIQ
ncbi:MAG: hypothetical protein KDD50_11475 [Bdellovibrionales bacterium]|nr:hypothetical protein [Bdellovibrionales bacterium]